MRITQIRSPADFGWWCVDQLGHGTIVLLAVSWFASGASEVAIAGAVILTIREGEQGRETIEEWMEAKNDTDGLRFEVRFIDLLRDLHLPDRFGDVAGGVAVSTAAFVGWPAWVRPLFA